MPIIAIAVATIIIEASVIKMAHGSELYCLDTLKLVELAAVVVVEVWAI